MELKKTSKADINKKSKSLWMMGLMGALAIVLVSFEWQSFTVSDKKKAAIEEDMLEEEIVPLLAEIKPPPPPPPPPTVVTTITLIDDDSDEEENIEEVDMEVDENSEIEEVEIVDEPDDEGEIFVAVDAMPEFPGGPAAFGKYLQKNIKYPDLAMETNTQGKVYVKFVVRKDGSIDQVQILRGIGAGCDEEAVRVIKSVPKWKPGEQMGKPVNVWYTLPVNFRLN